MGDTGTSLANRLLTWFYPHRGWWGQPRTKEAAPAMAEPEQPASQPEGATPSRREQE